MEGQSEARVTEREVSVKPVTETRVLDVNGAGDVQVIVSDRKDKVWVNVDGVCLFRAYRTNVRVEFL